jgi:hypothetical protein
VGAGSLAEVVRREVGQAVFHLVHPRCVPKTATDGSGYTAGYTEVLGWGGPLFNLLKRQARVNAGLSGRLGVSRDPVKPHSKFCT